MLSCTNALRPYGMCPAPVKKVATGQCLTPLHASSQTLGPPTVALAGLTEWRQNDSASGQMQPPCQSDGRTPRPPLEQWCSVWPSCWVKQDFCHWLPTFFACCNTIYIYMAMGQNPVPPVNIPIPTKIDQNGWCKRRQNGTIGFDQQP